MTVTATDFSQFADLRQAADNRDPEALREVANQFEALFVQSMLKSMRDASPGDPLFGSDQHDLYQSMMDEQLSLEMTRGKGIGLADMLVQQLGGSATPSPPRPYVVAQSVAAGVASAEQQGWRDPNEFVKDIWPYAERAARALNVAPQSIVAHAALETGWGAHVMPDAKGANSFNLFGIKAGSSWRGDQVTKQTLELQGATLRPQLAAFRSYDNVAATFSDYERFIGNNSRYEAVKGSGSDTAAFANALQSAGYATDPNYAEKLNSVANSPTMRRALQSIAELKNLPGRPITNGQSVRAR